MVVVPKTFLHIMNKWNSVMELPSLSDCLIEAIRPNVLFVTTVSLCKKTVSRCGRFFQFYYKSLRKLLQYKICTKKTCVSIQLIFAININVTCFLFIY